MSEDKKNPKEASNIFHSIMQASVKPQNNLEVDKTCPKCGAIARVMGQQVKGRFLVIRLDCPNGHTFERNVSLL
jgi:ssDNA-binding Zn-finger/Zn-ribbon topoisomerase 1